LVINIQSLHDARSEKYQILIKSVWWPCIYNPHIDPTVALAWYVLSLSVRQIVIRV